MCMFVIASPEVLFISASHERSWIKGEKENIKLLYDAPYKGINVLLRYNDKELVLFLL